MEGALRTHPELRLLLGFGPILLLGLLAVLWMERSLRRQKKLDDERKRLLTLFSRRANGVTVEYRKQICPRCGGVGRV